MFNIDVRVDCSLLVDEGDDWWSRAQEVSSDDGLMGCGGWLLLLLLVEGGVEVAGARGKTFDNCCTVPK